VGLGARIGKWWSTRRDRRVAERQSRRARRAAERQSRGVLGRWLLYLLTPPLAGVIALACYASAVAGLSAFAVGLFTAAAALVAGGLLGFLFAIPRSVATTGGVEGRFKSSTSLEEIADWLTKILVGLGLVELGKLVDQVGRLVDFIGPSLGPADQSRRAVALGLLALFSLSGFLLFYLATRIYLAPAFAYAEEQLRRTQANVEAARDQISSLPSRISSRLDAPEAPAAPETPAVPDDASGG
jgi:hypothetical protein